MTLVRVAERLAAAVVPNLWPAGQKWPARPHKMALEQKKVGNHLVSVSGYINEI